MEKKRKKNGGIKPDRGEERSVSNHVVKMGVLGILFGTCFLILILLLPQPYYKDGFRTLSDLQAYASTIDEWIKMENDNVFYPSYEQYYAKMFTKTFSKTIKDKISWLLARVHLKKPPLFSPSFFKTILEEVTQEREKHGWQGDFIQKIKVNEHSKVVVFGAVQGAFHSLVRDLEQLKKLGIIDEQLKLTNSDYYLVFLGNVINRSPYTLEIFALVLRLMRMNPEHVIYLRGPNELAQYWRLHTLRRELEIRMRDLSLSKIPLEKEADSFFNTLPITLYCMIQPLSGKILNYFKILPSIRDISLESKLHESLYLRFLKSDMREKIDMFDLKNELKKPTNDFENLVMKAIVMDIRKKESYEKMDGLRLLSPVQGVVAWSVLSTSAEAYRIFLEFFYDAFVIIQLDRGLQHWQITLYNRDIKKREDKNFKNRTYDFFSGEEHIG